MRMTKSSLTGNCNVVNHLHVNAYNVQNHLQRASKLVDTLCLKGFFLWVE